MPLWMLSLTLSAPAEAGDAHITAVLISLAAVLVATRIGGDLACRIGQPAVLGELVAGILLGPSLLGILDPTEPVMVVLGELGVLLLLFQIGLHTDLKAILRVGAPAAAVGIVGLTIPFVLGIVVLKALGFTGLSAIVAGAALTATSLGISARILSDLGVLNRPEGRVVIGAAVIDDVIGLIILSVVADLALGGEVTPRGVVITAAVAIGFLLVAIVVGGRVAPSLVRIAAAKRKESGPLGALAFAFALAMAAAAAAAGSAMIIGAFTAGLVLHSTPERKKVEYATTYLGHLLVPVFFAMIGAAVDVRSLLHPEALLVGSILIGVGVFGKVLAGYAPFWYRGNKLLIGVAMVPRGEVGLIVAQLGITSGALSPDLFSAVMLMVIGTTLIAPPWLGWIAHREGPHRQSVDDWGLDALVAGPQRKEQGKSADPS